MVGFMVGGAILKGVGDVKAGNAAKSIGDYNANVADEQATDAIARGTFEQQKFALGVKSTIGSQRAGFAGQNVDVGTGSPVDVTADAAYLGKLDEQTIAINAQREALGYKVQAQNARMGGQQAQTAGYFGAASTVLGTGASLLGAKYGWGKTA
jgi:hypothetical protein